MPLRPDLHSIIVDAANRHGVSPSYMLRTAEIESSGDPNANRNNGRAAKGLFQFIPSTAKQYGLSDPYDPAASADAAARLAADNAAGLRAKLGRDPTDAELYLAHQQGLGGATGLLSNPTAPAASIVGNAAVTQNAGQHNMTADDFTTMWEQRFGGAKAQGVPSNPTPEPAGAVLPLGLPSATPQPSAPQSPLPTMLASYAPTGASAAPEAAPPDPNSDKQDKALTGLLTMAQKATQPMGLLRTEPMQAPRQNPFAGTGILAMLQRKGVA